MSIWRRARKKPVTIEYREPIPQPGYNAEFIATREGTLWGYPGKDYIIRGVDGELYPIKKDIFKKTYDTLDDEEPGAEEVCCVCHHPLAAHVDEGDGHRCHCLAADGYQCECFLRKGRYDDISGYDLKRRTDESCEELRRQTGLPQDTKRGD